MDKGGSFIGTLWINKSVNFGIALLESGYGYIHSVGADQSQYSAELYAAENSARSSKKNVRYII